MGRRERLKTVTATWAARTLKSSRVAASVGRTAARRALEKALDRELAVDESPTARAMVEHMDTLKGLSMKLGQMISYIDGTMPPDAQRVLRRLQRRSSPLDFDAVREVVTAELGAPLEDRFSAFEPEPFAAASIGQVHRAVLDGRDVAVKVQYPQIARALQIDLGNLDKLGLLATLGTSFERSEVFGELRDRFLEECDYRLEAANQQLFADLWAKDPLMRVPEVVPSHCAERVLTSGLEHGESFYVFCEQADADRRRRVAERIYRFVYTGIFGHALFNADPHPGNYLFGDDDSVCFLDFGCVRYFPPEQVAMWKAIAWSIIEERERDHRTLMRDAGFVNRDDFDWDHHWSTMRYLYRPMTTEGFVFTREYVRDSIDLFVRDNPNVRKTRMPRAWVMVNRLQWGLNSILAELGTPGDWPTLFQGALDIPTVPAVRPPFAYGAAAGTTRTAVP